MSARFIGIVCCVLLAGCANDRYAATTGDPVQMKATLSDCKYAALKAYNDGHSHLAPIVGGLAAGLLAINDKQTVTLDDINPMIEGCMRDHGYVGTSSN